MTQNGKQLWYFPDGYLREKVEQGTMEAHEAFMLFNTHAYPVERLAGDTK